MAKFQKRDREKVPESEILVSCDHTDLNDIRIEWAKASPRDNRQCYECKSWLDWLNFNAGCPCDGDQEHDEPHNYRNGIIMKIRFSHIGEDKVIQVAYSTDDDYESKYFHQGIPS